MRQFIVVMLTLGVLSTSADNGQTISDSEKNNLNSKPSASAANNKQWLEWLSGLSGQGIDVAASDWLILSSNPSSQEASQIVRRYARYVDTGRLDRTLFQAAWHIADKAEFNPNSKLSSQRLASLSSDLPQFTPLVQALAYLHKWQSEAVSLFPDDLILFEGDQHPAINHLNQWLEDLDLASGLPEDAYSQQHKDVLTDVQLKFDLMPDGRLGAMTRQALLAITNERIRTLKANLERIRWLPKTLPYPHLKVDIAGLNVAYVVNANETYIHKAIVGTKAKKTPIFQDDIESVTVNPIWKVPHGIAANSLLKIEKKKPGFFREEGFRVYESWDDNAREVSPESVNWHKYTPRTFHHRLEQEPGELNRLGKFKLNLPNQYGVYLHDTDKPELFEENRRLFSSGCTRVEGIDNLVQRFARRQGSMAELLDKQQNPETAKVILNQSIPIYFVYFTAWPDSSGRVRFREDIYQFDNALTSWF